VLSKLANPVWRKPDWAFVEEGEPIPKDPGDRLEYGSLGEYALYFGNGYMIHGTLYERLLGRPVSHGCVRLGRELRGCPRAARHAGLHLLMRVRHLALVVTAALLAPITGGAAAPAVPAKAEDPETARLRAQVGRLRAERDLASGKGFYLRLDASRHRLALVLQGVTLDDYAASALEWGVPEVLFVDRNPGVDWDAAAFSKGRLEPERDRDRIEVVAPPPAVSASPGAETKEPSPPPVPKSAEESYSVPSPYRVAFAEGVSLEVRAKGEGRRNRSLFRRFGDALGLRLSDLGSALGLGAKERVRLRVTLEAEDAAALYRSLPPEVGLVVVGVPAS
jgi:hypothetical protein